MSYPPVIAGRALSFPRDHGAHPGYRTEWWYVTGWLRDEAGRERGFQLTFFRVRPPLDVTGSSRFSPQQLILAHAALADPANGRLFHAERAERVLPPLVAADAGNTDVKLHDWRLAWSAPAGAPGHYRAHVQAGTFAFDLELTPDGEPLLNGDAGFSRKASAPEHASYYYSRPQLKAEGQLRLQDAQHVVSGKAWLDHEWSSEIMPPDASGWDWIGINLDDGGALMAFRMRNLDGAQIWAGGTLRMPDGRVRILAPDALHFSVRRSWRSPRSGATYPVEMELEIAAEGAQPARRVRIAPMMDDQELDSRRSTGAIYWEGAVRVFEAGASAREIGRGYLEMTGYADPLKM
nr:carotenoid 1,2-hydratase [Azoarcus sp. L1K30]